MCRLRDGKAAELPNQSAWSFREIPLCFVFPIFPLRLLLLLPPMDIILFPIRSLSCSHANDVFSRVSYQGHRSAYERFIRRSPFAAFRRSPHDNLL